MATAFLFTDKAYQIEKKVHILLKNFNVKGGAGVEFFECSAIDAADAIQKASVQLNQPPVEISPVLSTPEVIAARIRNEERLRLAKETRRREVEQQRLLEEQRRREEAQKKAESDYKQGTDYLQKKDYSKAMAHYRNAASQDHTEAQYALGLCYANGMGVKRNSDKARHWYLKAIQKNHQKAQLALDDINKLTVADCFLAIPGILYLLFGLAIMALPIILIIAAVRHFIK